MSDARADRYPLRPVVLGRQHDLVVGLIERRVHAGRRRVDLVQHVVEVVRRRVDGEVHAVDGEHARGDGGREAGVVGRVQRLAVVDPADRRGTRRRIRAAALGDRGGVELEDLEQVSLIGRAAQRQRLGRRKRDLLRRRVVAHRHPDRGEPRRVGGDEALQRGRVHVVVEHRAVDRDLARRRAARRTVVGRDRRARVGQRRRLAERSVGGGIVGDLGRRRERGARHHVGPGRRDLARHRRSLDRGGVRRRRARGAEGGGIADRLERVLELRDEILNLQHLGLLRVELADLRLQRLLLLQRQVGVLLDDRVVVDPRRDPRKRDRRNVGSRHGRCRAGVRRSDPAHDSNT